jgi:SAM-dependent methyltransferase
MQDAHRISYFDKKMRLREELSSLEKERVRQTVEMVPPTWRRIVDVGCGDGRISCALAARGHDVLGIDWSTNSLVHYPGPRLVCDIRKVWPLSSALDGAVCCEVLEHLEPDEAQQVVQQLAAHTRSGFLITVPAGERLENNSVACQECGKIYHVWGHLQTFENFDAVDRMVGKTSSARRLLCNRKGIGEDRLVTAWRRRHGWYPHHPSYLCPHCGESLARPVLAPWNQTLSKGLSIIARLTAPFEPRRGWLASRYET